MRWDEMFCELQSLHSAQLNFVSLAHLGPERHLQRKV